PRDPQPERRTACSGKTGRARRRRTRGCASGTAEGKRAVKVRADSLRRASGAAGGGTALDEGAVLRHLLAEDRRGRGQPRSGDVVQRGRGPGRDRSGGASRASAHHEGLYARAPAY